MHEMYKKGQAEKRWSDHGTQHRYVTYNDRVGFYMNKVLEPIISSVVGTKVKRAYSFLCGYETFSSSPVLNAHTDREDNEFTLSVQIGYIRKPSHKDSEYKGWPLMVHLHAGRPFAGWRDEPPMNEVAECHLDNGDALFIPRSQTYSLP